MTALPFSMLKGFKNSKVKLYIINSFTSKDLSKDFCVICIYIYIYILRYIFDCLYNLVCNIKFLYRSVENNTIISIVFCTSTMPVSRHMTPT